MHSYTSNLSLLDEQTLKKNQNIELSKDKLKDEKGKPTDIEAIAVNIFKV